MVGNMKVTPKEKNVKANKMTKTLSVTNISADDKAKTIDHERKGDPRVDGTLIGKKPRSQTPTFLLTFEILIVMFTNV